MKPQVVELSPGSRENVPIVIRSDCNRIPPMEWSSFAAQLAKHYVSLNKLMLASFWAVFTQELTKAQVFEFGEVHDEELREEATRGGSFWQQGFLRMPFRCCIYWYEHYCDQETTEKLNGLGSEAHARYATLAVEVPDDMVAKMLPHYRKPVVMIVDFMREADLRGDMKCAYVLVGACMVGVSKERNQWQGMLLYSLLDTNPYDKKRIEGVVDNKLIGGMVDGVVGLSMVLSTKGLPIRVEEPSAKLNAKRAKAGKAPATRVTYVDYAKYHEAIRNTRAKGTHASPVPHLRRGHLRTYSDGHKVWIKDMLVNAKSFAEIGNRDHYEVNNK